MELTQLYSIVKLAETANFSRAAEQLFITQPALSQQVHALETELGLRLFERTTRKVSLTHAGEEFVAHAQRVLNEMDLLSQSMALCRREMGSSLSVGLLSTLSHLNIPEYISSFQTVYPNIQIQLQIAWSSNLIAQLLNRELDAAITNIHFTEKHKADPRLKIQVFSEDVIIVLANRKRAITQKEFCTVEDLVNEPIVANDKTTSIRYAMDAMFACSGVSPTIVCTCPDMESLIAMIRADMGICFLSSGVARQYMQDGGLISIPLRPIHRTQTAMLTLMGRREESAALCYFEDYFYGIMH